MLPGAISSTLDGGFHGFQYGRVFHLHNGQEWQQVSIENRAPVHAPHAAFVTIYQGRAGMIMRVEGEEMEVLVIRVR